jgi:nucleoside-diphosphate-sugar epimerase
MRAVVTGATGFIGHHLCAHLMASGDEVVGVDAFTDYYDRALKERNAALLSRTGSFALRRADLRTADLRALFEGAEVVYHLAGQPGTRSCWGREFETYAALNVLATQAVLEALRGLRIRKLVYASSSSVYGDAPVYPTAEGTCPRPISPYGVTKLAAEHLCELYRETLGVPTVSLRLFTVYGPRQRPDMAFARLIDAALDHRPFKLHGDGHQTRDFTHVSDVVTAMRAAACSDFTGVANIGGGLRITMRHVASVMERLVGPVELDIVPAMLGDVRHTGADITVAARAFGYRPRMKLLDGLTSMVEERMTRAEVPAGPPAAG